LRELGITSKYKVITTLGIALVYEMNIHLLLHVDMINSTFILVNPNNFIIFEYGKHFYTRIFKRDRI